MEVVQWLGKEARMMFTPIDDNAWPRREMFCYFSKMAPTGYSLTVNLDVTNLRTDSWGILTP